MKNNSTNYMVPVSIIIAGLMIAGAVFFSSNDKSVGNTSNNTVNSKTPVVNTRISLENLKPITSKDHILGDPNAPVKIVEYSDFECPYCKSFNVTMEKIMDEYGKNGEVAWVYRHFPIAQLHPKNAFKVAVISECVAEQKSNSAFWSFAAKFFELTPSNDQTDLDVVIPQITNSIGIDQVLLNKCVSSGKYDSHIKDNIANAGATGGIGSPWSILIAPNGKKFPINGAQRYETVKALIDMALLKESK